MKKQAKVLLLRAGIIAILVISGLVGIEFNKISKLILYNNNNNNNNNGELEILKLGEGERGPESFAFDGDGKGPYASIADGRVIKFQQNQSNWLHFASSNSTHTHRERCDGARATEPICGRPLGVCFNQSNGEMYIADAYMGLLKVGPMGGPATLIANGAEGIPFMFTNGIDIDRSSDTVFFTDSSSLHQRRNYINVILSGDKSGRLMKYETKSKQVTVLLRNLSFPNGVAVSKDGSFILVAETRECRILKYWIKTAKVEVFAELSGFPDNIKRSPRGGYWVGIHSKKDKLAHWILSHPWIGNAVLQLPLDLMRFYSILNNFRGSGMGIRLDENGEMLEIFEDTSRFKSVSEVMERDGHLWIGSVNFPFAGRYKLNPN